jgi:hypothetical protein
MKKSDKIILYTSVTVIIILSVLYVFAITDGRPLWCHQHPECPSSFWSRDNSQQKDTNLNTKVAPNAPQH